MPETATPFQAACLQVKPVKGDLGSTFDHLAESIRQAASEGADLCVLPESATTGYILEGGVDSLAISADDLVQELGGRLAGLPKPVDVAIGFYEQGPRRPHNSAAYIEFGDRAVLRHVYRKFFLPTYGVFDEHRFHEEGSALGVFDTRFGRLGLLICEDVWHSILATLLCVAGAQMVLVHSASPAREFQGGKPRNLLRYDAMLEALSGEHGVFCAMAMLAGFEGGKGLTGGSQIVDPYGNRVVQAETFGEQIVLAEVDLRLVAEARAATPLASDLKERWPDLLRIANGLEIEDPLA